MSSIDKFLKKIRKLLAIYPQNYDTVFSQPSIIFSRIQHLIPIILIVLSYFAFLQVRHKVYMLESATSPGPFFYIKYLNDFMYLFLRWIPAPLLMISAYFPQKRWLRVLALFSFIQQGALVNAIDVNENQYRPAIWLSIILLFLPNANEQSSRIKKHNYNTHFWFGLIFFSFAYSVAGFWKVLWGCVYQYFTQHLGFWNIEAMSYTITEYLLRTATFGNYPTAEWVAAYPLLGWILLMGATYAEATIWIVFFRPSLWKIYGALMILLHTGSKITLNIGFEAQYILTGIIFFASPFAVQKDFWATLADMPGVHLSVKIWKKTKTMAAKDK